MANVNPTETLPTSVSRRAAPPIPPPGLIGDGGAAPSAADFVLMLRRRFVLTVVLFVLFSAIAVGGFVAWWVYLPGFRSECLIECISNIPDGELSMEQDRLKQEEHERFVRTQAMLLKSPSILAEALKVTAVRDTGWYGDVKNNEYLLDLTEQLMAEPVRGTNFLRVAIECRRRDDPAVLVNEVVRQWYNTVKRRSAEQFASKSLTAAQEEMSLLERQIEGKRGELKRLAARLPAGARQNPAHNINAQHVEQYGSQVAQLTLELSQLEQFRQVYNNPAGVAATAEDRAMVEQHPQIAELSRTLFLLEQQRTADARVYGTEHRELKQRDAQIAAVAERLGELRLEKLQERQNDIREATNTAYLNTQHALFLAQENLARAEAALQDQDELLLSYVSLEEQMQKDADYLLDLNNYVKNLNRVVRQQTAVNVNIAQPATEPLEQSSPSLIMLPVGVFLAMVLSVGSALGVEMLDKSVRTTQDIARHLDIAMLGAVPDTDDEEVKIGQVETAVQGSPRSMVAEAFRHIRTNLQFSAPVDRQRSVLITSPRADDGKTTVASNLALAVAQGGRRVLLVDANFRRPALHQVYSKIPAHGLSNILAGDRSLESCVWASETASLDVLGSGPMPPNPAELLGGESWRTFLAEAVDRYDQVIIDTAPVLLASDALVLGTSVDGVILVIRAKANSRGGVQRAVSLLQNVASHLFGAVLNAAQVTRGGYFREQLRDYYDYQADADEGAKALTKPAAES